MRFICLAVCLNLSFFGFGQKDASNEGKKIMEKAIAFHGGDSYENQTFLFTFRTGDYTCVHNSDGMFTYTSSKVNKAGTLIDINMTNSSISYKEDGQQVVLEEKRELGARSGLNSVIYFFTLPYKLQDESVQFSYVRSIEIKGIAYHEIEVRFKQEGGGEDFSDIFRYWVRKDTYKIDYLAYVYFTGKGGVRFREAFNDRRVASVLFQDYNNYMASKETNLDDLPSMFEAGELKLLSKIESENVRVGEVKK